MTVWLDECQQSLTVITERIDVPPGSGEELQEAGKIFHPHTAIGKEQSAIILTSLITHHGFVQKTLDTLVVPDFIDDFRLISAHRINQQLYSAYHTRVGWKMK